MITTGVYINRLSLRVVQPAARTQVAGFWNTLVFIVNTVLFLVVGLQLHGVADAAFQRHSWPLVIGYALAENAVLIIVRLVLAVLAESRAGRPCGPIERMRSLSPGPACAEPSRLRRRWPSSLSCPTDRPFPERDLVIFLTYSVILVTLVGGGLSLRSIVRWLHVGGGTEERDELRRAIIGTAEAALSRTDELAAEGRIDAAAAETLRVKFIDRRDLQRDGDETHVRHDLPTSRASLTPSAPGNHRDARVRRDR